jgi:DNA-binding NarL/FixJ family response regulator
MIRVLVVDDHAVVRGGVARILERAGDLHLVGEAATGPEAVALARGTPADVCILDLDMPGGGLALVERLRAARPDLRLLVFSQHDERDFALRSLEAGAHGYLSKETGLETIETAIRRVAAGRRYLSDAAQDLLLDRAIGGEPERPHHRLSSRELEVVRMLSRGMRATDIAVELGISVKTVSTHRTNALAKLGLANTIELALYAREHGLV